MALAKAPGYCGIGGKRRAGRRIFPAAVGPGGAGPLFGRLPGVPDGEPAHQPFSVGAQGHGAGGGQAAVRIRRQPGDRRHRSDPLSHLGLPGAGAVRRSGPGGESAAAAPGAKNPGGAGFFRPCHAEKGAGADRPGHPQRRKRIPGTAVGGPHRGAADGPGLRQGAPAQGRTQE